MTIEKALKHFEPGTKTIGFDIGGGGYARSKPILADYESIGRPVHLEYLYENWLHYGQGSKYSGDKFALDAFRKAFTELIYVEIATTMPDILAKAIKSLGDDPNLYSINFNPSYNIKIAELVSETIKSSRVGKDPGKREICRILNIDHQRLRKPRPLAVIFEFVREIIQIWEDKAASCI